MSRAFVKETENDTIGLPDRPISPHRNFVTEAGLADIEAALGRFESAHRAAVAYQTSGNPAFLTTAEAIATYFVDHLPTNTFIPPWDFDAPAGAPVDTSAAAIAADGLVMLSTVAGTSGSTYLTYAENILGSLSANYLDDNGDNNGPGESVLIDGFPGNGGTNTALIYGDYYFTEALLRLQNVRDGKPDWVLYSPVPEPSTWAMMLLGFAGLGFAGVRARATKERAVQ